MNKDFNKRGWKDKILNSKLPLLVFVLIIVSGVYANLVYDNGNVGIGTASPDLTLDVSGTVRIIDGTNKPYLQSTGYGYSPTTYKVIQIGNISGPLNSIGIALGIDPNSIVGGAFTGNEIAFPNTVEFMQANSDGTNWIQNVFALNNGNVGIGTTTPYAYDTTATRLQVKSGAVEVATFTGQADADGALATVRVGTDNDRGIYIEGGRTGTVPYGAIGVTEANGVKTAGIRINNLGNVGIGTTSPGAKLEVSDTLSGIVTKSTSPGSAAYTVIPWEIQGSYSGDLVITVDATAWAGYTYDIKVGGSGQSMHHAGAFYNNLGIAGEIKSISNGGTLTISQSNQVITFTLDVTSMLNPFMTFEIGSGGGYAVKPSDVTITIN